MRYEEYLASQLESDDTLDALAFVQVAGLADRLPRWLPQAQRRNSSLQVLHALFQTVINAEAPDIEIALASAEVRGLYRTSGFSFDEFSHRLLLVVMRPLILPGRSDVLAALYDSSVRRFRSLFDFEVTVRALHELAKAGAWDALLSMLRSAQRHAPTIDISRLDENCIWRLAYLHGAVETVMPELAEFPFRSDQPKTRERRQWQLAAYRIRSGRTDIRVPVIAGKQPDGYAEAAAMQIAALADDPSAADLVDQLKRVVRPHAVRMSFVDEGVAVRLPDFWQELLRSEAAIAARRKDHAKSRQLADRESGNIFRPSSEIMIDAFLEEGDWRGAAMIAELDDERDRAPIEGFADDRHFQYMHLRNVLAATAARGGDDAAAAAFLAMAKEGEAERQSRLAEEERDAPGTDRFLWLDMILAAAAQGLFPRALLPVVTPVFRAD